MWQPRESDTVVAVVDDAVSAREGLQSLIQSAGRRAETFASAQEHRNRRATRLAGPGGRPTIIRWLNIGCLMVSLALSVHPAAAEPRPLAAGAPIRLPLIEGKDIRFTHLSTEQGLSQSRVDHMLQDRRGFIWIGTYNGLNRYDGYRFETYKPDPRLSLEEGLGRGWEAAVHPHDLGRFGDAWRTAVASGKPMEIEARVCRADGQYRRLLVRNVPLRDKGGKIVKWYGMSADIDDRKRVEEALHRSNRELQAISACNQILLRATDEQSLLQEICRIVSEEAGYHMAWVGYAEHDEAKSALCRVDRSRGGISRKPLGNTWGDTERGCRPTGPGKGLWL